MLSLKIAPQENLRAQGPRVLGRIRFPAMPRFRQDTIAWEAFVRSWCESIAVETAKNRTLSLVAKRIKDVMKYLQKDLSELSWSEIAELLRQNWEAEWEGEGISLGDWIVGYHESLGVEFKF